MARLTSTASITSESRACNIVSTFALRLRTAGVRRAEGGARVEREKHVIKEARRPPAGDTSAEVHLGEQEVLRYDVLPGASRAGPPPSVSQYQAANVATLMIHRSAASRNNAGADVLALSADKTSRTVLTTTATVTNPITPRLMRRARRWLPADARS